MDLYLREVTEEDRDLLFEWANDPVVRRNAFHTEPISYETHVRWFRRMLENEAVHQYILCRAGEPIGQIRLEVADGTALIGYSVASGQRGKGLGTALLALAGEKAGEVGDVKRLVGQVKRENIASQRAFEKCGYRRTEEADYITFVFEL
ncbi:MAG: GNAT family N-acetyltransferase [Roseburia sp.]|nr:GNAT family N-acetyltransferase [Roseburia sp.]